MPIAATVLTEAMAIVVGKGSGVEAPSSEGVGVGEVSKGATSG